MLATVNVRYLTNRGFSHDKITSEIYKYAKNNGKHADTTLDYKKMVASSFDDLTEKTLKANTPCQ